MLTKKVTTKQVKDKTQKQQNINKAKQDQQQQNQAERRRLKEKKSNWCSAGPKKKKKEVNGQKICKEHTQIRKRQIAERKEMKHKNRQRRRTELK